MNLTLGLAALTLAVLNVSPVLALDCRRTSSPVEAAICRDPKLLQLDHHLDEAYRRVRAASIGGGRLALLNQQRAWIQSRDTTCASADVDCLKSTYTARLAQLKGLNGKSQPKVSRPAHVGPAVLNGTWRINSIRTTTPETAINVNSLRQALGEADLPPVGSTVQAAQGRLCSVDQPCEHMNWSSTSLDRVDGGPRIAQVLDLPQDHRVYTGSTGSPQSNIFLIPNRDKSLLAYFILCAHDATNCQIAFEVWVPVSRDATISPP